MPNAIDYAGWRGDLSFTADPFGEVDALILSELSYLDFAEIIPEDKMQEIPLSEAAERYFAVSGEEQPDRKSIRMSEELLQAVKGSARFGQIMLFGYRSILSKDRDVQMAAVSFRLGKELYFTAFRGTDNTITGWKEDFMMSYVPITEGQKLAASYVNEMYTGRRGRILLGGHSKGGNLAVYAGCFCRKRIRARILSIYSNDGPGFRAEVLATPEYAETEPKIISIVPEDSVIGMLLGSKSSAHIVKSSEKGIASHAMLSWQVYGKHFVEAEKHSGGSAYLDRTIDRWIEDLDDAERKRFVETAFELIERSGAETFGQIREGKLAALREIYRQARQLPKEDLSEFASVIARLFRTGGEEAWLRIKGGEESEEGPGR